MLAPGAGNVQVLQVVSYRGVLGEAGLAGIADSLPGACAAGVDVAFLLLQAQVRST